MDKTEITIIGAGVVGLAIAAELANRFPNHAIVLLERHDSFGQETSSRNSEVVHAGIYYPQGSLKARLCVEGNRLLYDFSNTWHIPFNRCGKLIVANTDEEVATLDSLITRGRENGVMDLQWLDRPRIASMEPDIRAVKAIFSPSTGIVDSHQLMARLEWLALKGNVVCAYQHAVSAITRERDGFKVSYDGPQHEPGNLKTTWLINCAGLASDGIAAMMGIDVDQAGYRLYLCKGEYFSIPLSKSKRVSRLMYPPPYKDLKGLGIHVTKMLDGMIKLGPNAFYVDELDYTVDPEHAEEFYDSVEDYLPFLERDDLQPDMAGIRPKLQAPGTPIRDFVVCHEKERGLKGAINLIGIESPGLTSCLSLAKMVGDILGEEIRDTSLFSKQESGGKK